MLASAQGPFVCTAQETPFWTNLTHRHRHRHHLHSSLVAVRCAPGGDDSNDAECAVDGECVASERSSSTTAGGLLLSDIAVLDLMQKFRRIVVSEEG